MKKTEGESGKACTYRRWKERGGRLSNEEDRKRELEGCTYRRWKEKVGRLSNEEDGRIG